MTVRGQVVRVKPSVSFAQAVVAWNKADPATRGPYPINPNAPRFGRHSNASTSDGMPSPHRLAMRHDCAARRHGVR